MAEQQFWQRVVAAVNRVYERRVRAASLVGEYGADHAGHHGHDAHEEDGDGGEVAVIANVPRGTPVGRRSEDGDQVDAHP